MDDLTIRARLVNGVSGPAKEAKRDVEALSKSASKAEVPRRCLSQACLTAAMLLLDQGVHARVVMDLLGTQPSN
jgi:hypothetical protein